MNKYCFIPRYLLEIDEHGIQFYTHTGPYGVIATTVWKYEIGDKKLQLCFEMDEKLHIWKYTANQEGQRLQYIGLTSGAASSITGLDSCGEILFRYKVGGIIGTPVYDMYGNIYISVNGRWIFCLNKEGELLWKWKLPFNSAGGLNEIVKYWISCDRLYVIANGREYVIALDSNTEGSHELLDYNNDTQCKVRDDNFFFRCQEYSKLQCYNLNAEKMWDYTVSKNEMISEITVGVKNLCLKVRSRTDDSVILYVLDKNGVKQWSVEQGWNHICISSNEEVMLINGKSMSIYNSTGKILLQYSGKERILWGNLIGDKLVMIVEWRGSLSILERDINSNDKVYISKLKAKEKTKSDLSTKAVLPFQENLAEFAELAEYLLLNTELWMRYSGLGIREIIVSYEIFKTIQIQVLSDENIWVDGMVKNIPYDRISEEDRDLYKECGYRDDIVWVEFCAACPEGQIGEAIEQVCNHVSKKLGIPVKLQTVQE